MGKKRIKREMRATKLYFRYQIKQTAITKEHLSSLLKKFPWKGAQLKNDPIIAQTNDEVQVFLIFDKIIYLNDINRLGLAFTDSTQANNAQLVGDNNLLENEHAEIVLPITICNCKSTIKIFEWIANNDASYIGFDSDEMKLTFEKRMQKWLAKQRKLYKKKVDMIKVPLSRKRKKIKSSDEQIQENIMRLLQYMDPSSKKQGSPQSNQQQQQARESHFNGNGQALLPNQALETQLSNRGMGGKNIRELNLAQKFFG